MSPRRAEGRPQRQVRLQQVRAPGRTGQAAQGRLGAPVAERLQRQGRRQPHA